VAPLLPEQDFEVVFRAKPSGQITFEVVANGAKFAIGTLSCTAVQPAT
jgi:hypothetical protein